MAWTAHNVDVDPEGGMTFRRFPEIGLGRDFSERVLIEATKSAEPAKPASRGNRKRAEAVAAA